LWCFAPLRYRPVRNGLPPLVPYDPSPAARAWRKRTHRVAQEALAQAEAKYGPRPQTVRGLPKKPRRKPATAT